eukprot:CAMPEP_0181168610 /NCGR_PEP_ID=MMETSP1096-20121128/368_1 /TAXON_ID=156174 ORGANISM="Chrysochromulina ericina, Strain CCMP281" /NCGR_SAMPLE_ID=MMETSP1096 /ASSEMBLY_ACC=CAM_ASM_000453 /LENGTH=51 /DNA_ID=CAMNT_0023256003 /DNA_START=472 /DNA_END=624 /DNA_ORIENTATION=+
MPHVHYQHQPGFVRLVMDCMFKGIVEQHDLTFGPSACLAADDDLAISIRDK